MSSTDKKLTIEEAVLVLQSLDMVYLETTVEHLQLRRKTVKDLKKYNIGNLQRLIKSAECYYGKSLMYEESNIRKLWLGIEFEIEDRLSQLAHACSSGKIDWIMFWDTIGYEFTFAAAKLDEVCNFDDKTNAIAIDSLNIGKAVIAFKEDGIRTVGDLVPRLSKGLPDYRGFGKNKLWIFVSGLREFMATVNAERTSSSISILQEPNSVAPKYRGKIVYRAKNRAKMSDSTKKLRLAQLHLHKEINKLQSIGVEQLDHLLDLFEKGLPDIKGVGHAARVNLLKTVKFLDSAVEADGGVDWRKFAQLSEIAVYPESDITLANGEEFIDSMEHVVGKLTTVCFDEIESATLIQRLIPDNKSTTSLEGIGNKFGVTRERIRQKQNNILGALSAALIDNEYEGMKFRFSDDFSKYWRMAAMYFGTNQTLSYFDFVSGLSEVWKVDEVKIRKHLPLIYSILTKDSMLPSEFAVSSFLPVEVYTITKTSDLNRPFVSLHPTQKLAKYADDNSVKTIGQLLQLLRTADTTYSKSIRKKFLQEILMPLSKVVDSSGAVSWVRYYELKKIKFVPPTDITSSADFVKVAIASVVEFVQGTRITARAEGILIHRIIPDAATRKTLSETTEIFGCAAPQIKREENELLRHLHEAIFSDDYTDSGVHFRDSFVQKWKQCARLIQQSEGNFNFVELLSLEWCISKESIIQLVPMIAAIIKGRPPVYTGKKYSINSSKYSAISTKSEKKTENGGEHTVIRLRGFRYIH